MFVLYFYFHHVIGAVFHTNSVLTHFAFYKLIRSVT